jgi:transcriptional regulator of heat shock response
MTDMPENMDERLRDVFRIVVREYLRSAEPVASAHIVARHRLGVSPATIRNDMAELEERGLLEQPHTSAGRIPTEAGYRYYVDEFVHRQALEERRRKELEVAVAEFEREQESAARKFAKTVAEITGETAVIRIGSQAYLTGVQNLMDKPEFREGDLVRAAMRAVDELDALVGDLERRAQQDVSVLIGDDNPFGSALSSVVTVFAVPDVGEAVIGVLGPRRMDYDTNVALMRYIRDRLEDLE